MNATRFLHLRLAVILVAGNLSIAATTAAEPARRAATTGPQGIPGLIQFTDLQGIGYSALILPAASAPAIAPISHDHVIIIDTSASQTGTYRTRSLAVAVEVCRLLPARDRVRLIATDVTAEELTTEFSPARSAD